jgi:ferredoxin
MELVFLFVMKITHLRKDCIGCGACAAIAPDFWTMDEEDSLSTLKGSVAKGDLFELEVSDEDAINQNKEASEVCPVDIIKLVDEEKKEE